MRNVNQIAWLGLLSLYALLSAGCLPKVVTRAETIRVPVSKKEYVPAEYLAPTPHPPPPIPLCSIAGEFVLCNPQLIDRGDAEADALDMCNADKAAGRAWVAAGGGVNP